MKILLVEDLDEDRKAVAHLLQQAGHSVVTIANAGDALSQSESVIRSFDAAVIDWQLPDNNGSELGRLLFNQNPRLFLIMLTAFSTVQREMEARRCGGFIHFISKPGSSELLETLTLLEPEVQQRRDSFKRIANGQYGILGTSAAIVRIRELIATVAPTDARVLILGESGTGKELIATALHNESKRRSNRFMAINCAAIPENLLESELFGHEKGAFTGAQQRKVGRVEQAEGGTLFLDEIAEMNQGLQAKLLRFLEDGSFTRLGGNQELRVNVRVIAATNRDVSTAIRQNQLREDLYYRLNVIEFHSPPLRERGNDIVALADNFLQQFRLTLNKKSIQAISAAARETLLAHHWPGNVRELRNAMEQAVIRETTAEVQSASLPDFSVAPDLRISSIPQAPNIIEKDSTAMQSHTQSTSSMDFAKLASCCLDISRTNGTSIQNDPDVIYHSEGPQFLKAVLAAFNAEVKAKRLTQEEFNRLFGFLTGKRQKTEIRQYLQQLTRRAPQVFKPYSGTNQYGMRDLVAEGNKLIEAGFKMPDLKSSE